MHFCGYFGPNIFIWPIPMCLISFFANFGYILGQDDFSALFLSRIMVVDINSLFRKFFFTLKILQFQKNDDFLATVGLI